MEKCARKDVECNAHTYRAEFGYATMGPILADMCLRLYQHLNSVNQDSKPIAFFCSRGGLTLRRSLTLFAQRTGLEVQIECEDFLISRLSAFRVAFQRDPLAIRPLIDLEFAGRSCGQAIRALWNIDLSDDLDWKAPFSLARLIQLAQQGGLERSIKHINNEQADLLRRYIGNLRGPNRRVLLCDTGVYGSIHRYLQVGMPEVDWNSVLLFRANYKRIPAPHFLSTTGLMSESDMYLPWNARTSVLLYWPLLEAMFEPDVPTVRWYYAKPAGKVVADLDCIDWRNHLEPPAGSVFAGALGYLRDLTPESLTLIEPRARNAWNSLRGKIVFPNRDDVSLLEVGSRSLDFGIDETAEFTSRLNEPGRALREKLSLAASSIWPEGELRKQLSWAAGPFLVCSEVSRWIRAFNLRRI